MRLSFEDYIRGVYYLEKEQGLAKPLALARRLRVSKNTVSAMVGKLAGRRLLSHEKYGIVTLTPSGKRLAKKLTYKHRLIELFLARVLGVPENRVHKEACGLEHSFSKESIRGMAQLLKNPKVDPHGKPLNG